MDDLAFVAGAEGRSELDRALVFYREVGASAHLAAARELLFALT